MAAAAASRAPLFLLEGSRVKETKALIPKFYRLPWVSGVRKDMSVFPWPYKPPKCWDCSPLFLKSQAYPKIIAVLVGKVVDDSRLSAKMQVFGNVPCRRVSCYHNLFYATTKFHQIGFDWATPSHGPIQISQRVLGGHQYSEVTAKAGTSSSGIQPPRRCIVLDIEGTTTPISFVKDVLFPYARDNVRKHLELTYDTAEAQDDIKLLRAQVQEDLANNVIGAVHIPSDGDREEVIATVVANVEAMIKADRKITSLKQLQGHIWRTGFQNNEIETVVYDDVPEALEKWHAIGLKVYIYSSGSRLAQRLLFGNTSYGDLRKYLCGFFDTTIGNKKETKSYVEIAESLGVDYPSAILFVTDVYEEATAAKAAGLEVMISIRPGNGPLPENHGFQTINSFSEI